MDTFPLEKFVDKGKGVYALCLLATKRAIQLNKGESAPLAGASGKKATTIALEEIIHGLLAANKSAE